MKKQIHPYIIIGIVFLFVASCTKDDLSTNSFIDSELIKSQWADGNILTNYKYNEFGKISEVEDLYFYHKFIYDDLGKLIKEELAADLSILSSSIHVQKTELMKAENCTISWYHNFIYDNNNNLSEVENYFKEGDVFVLKSKRSFEYESGNIIKVNLHNEKGDITQFYTYEYDGKGNVINDKYYTYLFIETTQPKLMSEISYKFDNKKNPLKILSASADPGLLTNSNNIIETRSILYDDVPGIDNYSTSKIRYLYNSNNYPVKVITDSGVYEYKY